MHDIAHAAADAARVPDFEKVLAKGRRHRNRRQGIAVGAAAIAVATIVGVTQVVGGGRGGPPEPAPPPDLPTGSEPTNLPYWVDGTLHVGDVAIETDLESSYYAAGTTVVGPGDEDDPNAYYLVDGSDLVPIADSEQMMLATISRDGQLVALLEFSPGDSQRLFAWDVESRSEVASVDIPADPARPFQVVGIDLDHRVFLTDGRAALMWVPGEAPIPVTGVDPGDLGALPWPGGLAHQRNTGGSIAIASGDAFGTVDDRGRFSEVGTISTTGFGTWSPGGEVFVAHGATDYSRPNGGTLGLEYADGRQPDTLDLPEPGFWRPVAWESETQLVLWIPGNQPDPLVSAPTEDLVRCDVVARTCTRIAEVPDGGVTWAIDAGAGF